MGWRISVDTGGTFTDVVVADPEGRFTVDKAPTTPERIFEGMREALLSAAQALAISLETLLGRADILIYGTTRATNAIVTGQVASTAFLTTLGFPDVLVQHPVYAASAMGRCHVDALDPPHGSVAPVAPLRRHHELPCHLGAALS